MGRTVWVIALWRGIFNRIDPDKSGLLRSMIFRIYRILIGSQKDTEKRGSMESE